MNPALLCTKGLMYLILSQKSNPALAILSMKPGPIATPHLCLSRVKIAPYVVSSWLLPFTVDFGKNSAAETCSLCPEMPLCQPDQASNKTGVVS